jgi:NADP-dependent 3-hydroxy acid dehydrogenase YdfG
MSLSFEAAFAAEFEALHRYLRRRVGAAAAEDLTADTFLYCTQAALPHLLAAAEAEPRRVADLVNISSVAGRKANAGSGVYNLAKFGVGAFSESLRMELAKRHVRVSLVEPGFTKTELGDHIREELQEWARQRSAGIERLESEDIADAIAYVVTRPRRVAVSEVTVRPAEQEF